MKRFRLFKTLGSKIIALVIGVSSISLVIACAWFLIVDLRNQSEELKAGKANIAELMARTISTAVVFRDADAVADGLAVFSTTPDVLAAIVATDAGVLASFRVPGFNRSLKIDYGNVTTANRVVDLGDSLVVVVTPIRVEPDLVGELHLFYSTNGLQKKRAGFLVVALQVFAAAIFASLLAATNLHRGVTAPLARLSDAMRRIRLEKDYSQTVPGGGTGDETAALIQSFNAMLAEIRQRDAHLEKAVAELVVARDAAEEASVAKTLFLANMSHELRTPLNAVIGYSEILIEENQGTMSKDGLDDLERIRNAGQHLLQLINEVLDLSKIDAGQMRLDPHPVDAEALVNQCFDHVWPAARQNNNRLRLEPMDGPISLRTDPLRLRQCVLNLLSNAVKFTTDGDVTVAVRRDVAQPDIVMFEVRDTGIGITPAQMATLFQPFVQGDAETTRKYSGTGLGLVITRRFAQLLGGEVTMESEAGRGSLFVLSIRSHPQPPEAALFKEDVFPDGEEGDGSPLFRDDEPDDWQENAA